MAKFFAWLDMLNRIDIAEHCFEMNGVYLTNENN